MENVGTVVLLPGLLFPKPKPGQRILTVRQWRQEHPDHVVRCVYGVMLTWDASKEKIVSYGHGKMLHITQGQRQAFYWWTWGSSYDDALPLPSQVESEWGRGTPQILWHFPDLCLFDGSYDRRGQQMHSWEELFALAKERLLTRCTQP